MVRSQYKGIRIPNFCIIYIRTRTVQQLSETVERTESRARCPRLPNKAYVPLAGCLIVDGHPINVDERAAGSRLLVFLTNCRTSIGVTSSSSFVLVYVVMLLLVCCVTERERSLTVPNPRESFYIRISPAA